MFGLSIKRFLWLVALALILLLIGWKLQLVGNFEEIGLILVTAIPGLILIKILSLPSISGSVKFLLLFTAGAGFPAWISFVFLFRSLKIEPSWAVAFLAAYPMALLIAEVLERTFGLTFP